MNVSDSMRSYEIMVGTKFRFNANFAAPLCEHYQQQYFSELPTTGQSDCVITTHLWGLYQSESVFPNNLLKAPVSLVFF